MPTTVLALTVATSCGDDASTDSAAPATRPAVTPAPTPAPSAAYVAPSRSGEIVGHVRVADPAALLAKLEPYVPDAFVGRMSPEGIRRRLSVDATPATAAVVSHVDFGKAAACVLLDPVRRSEPFACVFGYEGGLEQLTVDLGTAGVVDDDAAGLHVLRGETSMYFDALGDRIVWAGEPDAFEAARDYLGALKNPGGSRDLEVVVYAAFAAEHYREQLSRILLATMTAMATDDGASSSAVVDGAKSALSSVGPAVTEQALDALDGLAGVAAQLEHVAFHASITEQGLALGLAAEPRAGTGAGRWAQDAVALPESIFEWLPHGTWLLWASHAHASGPLLPHWRTLRWHTLAHYVARFSEQSSDDVLAAGAALDASQQKTYGDWTLFAAYNSPATRGGAMLVRPVSPDADARNRWLALSRAATAEALFGEALAATIGGTLRWSVVPAASSVEGLTVDEWRLHAADGLLDRLEGSLDTGSIGAEIIAALRERPALVALQRFEYDGAVVFTVAPGAGESYARKVLRAKKGDGRLARTGVDAIIGGRGKVSSIAALSAFDLVQALREMAPPELRADLPDSVGQNLSDAFATSGVTDDGVVSQDLVVSPYVLSALRDALRVFTDDAPEPTP